MTATPVMLRIAIVGYLASGCMALHAASIVDVELTPQDKPLGKRIRVAVYFPSQSPGLELQLRVLLRGRNQRGALARAQNPERRDRDGNFVLCRSLTAPATGGMTTAQYDLAYEDLALPAAQQQTIAIELRGNQEERLQFAHVLPWMLIDLAAVTSRDAPLDQTRRASWATLGAAGDQSGKDGAKRLPIEVVESAPPIKNDPETGQVDPASAPDLSKSLQSNMAASFDGTPWVSLAQVANPQERVVYFATNRNPALAGDKTLAGFGASLSDETTYGSCLVNIPVKVHHKGNLETAGWLNTPAAGKVFAIDAMQSISPRDLRARIGSDDVLIFVHGFANTFQDAVLRSAQLRYDIDFPATVVCFSWASAGNIGQYQSDARQAAASTDALVGLLKTAIASRDPQAKQQRKIHLFAHSMGNRILLDSVYKLLSQDQVSTNNKPFGQIVLAAPDVGATEFNHLVDFLIDSADRVTYYYSRLDSALRVSQKLNSYEPVGLYPYFEARLDTICADHLDTSFIGHTYYATSDRMLSDLRLIFTAGLAPDARQPPLVSRQLLFGHPYWSFELTRAEAKPEAPRQTN